MRILIEQAIYDMRNKGNVALLQTAVNRFHQLWPGAHIDVLAEAPYILKLYSPQATPVSVYKCHDWSSQQARMAVIQRWLPQSLMRLFLELRAELDHRRSASNSTGDTLGIEFPEGQGKQTITTPDPFQNMGMEDNGQNGTDFWQALRSADLVVASGGGYLSDADKPYLRQVLGRLKLALDLGKPVVMVGQGVGPIEDPELRAMLCAILPAVELILVREQRVAIPLLQSLGVDSAHIRMTGDDAIEMAYLVRQNNWGNGIGVNLRIASYTQVRRQSIAHLRTSLHRIAFKYNAPLVAIPISQNTQEADLAVTRELLAGYPHVSIGRRRFDTPRAVIHKIARCRIVVTGAYHAAVFGLAQGIPVVGLVKSTEYLNKFGGLADEFGSGCQIVRLDDPELDTKLEDAIDYAWQAAETLRPQLLAAAERQIQLGHAAYAHLYHRIEAKNNQPATSLLTV